MGVGRHAQNKSSVGLEGSGKVFSVGIDHNVNSPNLLLRRHLLTLPPSPPPFPDRFKEKDHTDTTGRSAKNFLIISHLYIIKRSFSLNETINGQIEIRICVPRK